MEGNFETNSMSQGSSNQNPASGSNFETGNDLMSGHEGNSEPKMTWMDYLQDGVEKGYYKSETNGIFDIDEVVKEANQKMYDEENRSVSWSIEDLSGTPHERLEELSQINDEDIERNIEDSQDESVSKIRETSSTNESDGENLTFEEQIIKLQAEAMKLMAESINGNNKNKDAEELAKKLRQLLDQIEKDKGISKTTLMSGALAVMSVLMNIIEGGYKKLENEVERARG